MSGTARAGVVVTLLVLVLALAPMASAQAPPSTLLDATGDLYLLSDGLAEEVSGSPTNCVAIAPGGDPTDSQSFDIQLENGSYYPLADAISVELSLRSTASAGDQEQSAVIGTGFTVTGTLAIGGTTVTATRTFDSAQGQGATTPSASLAFTVDRSNVSAGTGPLTLTIALAASEAGGVVPIRTADAAVVCNRQGSLLQSFAYARGQIGDGDIDGDGIPDSEDPDRDGDGVPNAQEEHLTCESLGGVNFADDPALQPEPHDFDGDGQSDEFECANGSDPKNALSMVAQPAGIPWLLLIMLLVILILIGAIAFLFLKFGKIVDLNVVSSPELILQAGKLGKFELAAESRRTKGEPVTLQIAVEGMPEGWDARTDVDHVTVEPQGSDGARKTFFVSVEAPEHEDPESAVVTVKAIPLNKQGRKDTFKLASKAQTVTSINVPPDARVPVKRGGPIKLKTPEEEVGPEGIPVPPEGLPVEDIPGVGAAQAKKLKAEGIETTEALRKADAAELAKKTKIGESDIQRWQRVSDLIRVPGVTPDYGDVLVDAGYHSPAKLAEAKPEEIEEKVNAKATPPATADLDMEVA